MEKILEALSKKMTEVYEKLYSLSEKAEKQGNPKLALKLRKIGRQAEQVSINIEKLWFPPPKS